MINLLTAIKSDDLDAIKNIPTDIRHGLDNITTTLHAINQQLLVLTDIYNALDTINNHLYFLSADKPSDAELKAGMTDE